MLKMTKMGHFWARKELFLIFLKHPSLEFSNFLLKVRQLCLLIIFIFCVLKKSNYTQNEQKEMCAFGSETTKILFSPKSFNRFFFFMKVGSNKCKNMTKPGFWKKLFIMLKMRKMGHFWARNELFLFFLTPFIRIFWFFA